MRERVRSLGGRLEITGPRGARHERARLDPVRGGGGGPMIRVLIADDHAVVREGLKRIVAENADMEVAGEAGNGHEVLDFARKHDCDLVLLDLAMPGKDGLDTLKELKLVRPHLPVLVLSVYPEEQYAVRLLRAGAAGYLTKESAPEELVAAIRKVSRGGRYVSEALAEQLAVAARLGRRTARHTRPCPTGSSASWSCSPRGRRPPRWPTRSASA